MPGMDQPLNSEKDIPLREDIRLLGRILGDTVRSQEGDAVFDIIEGIRQSSIRFRRDEDQVARRELEAALIVCRATKRSRSSAHSAISPTSRTSPRTSTTSEGPARMWAFQLRARAASLMR